MIYNTNPKNKKKAIWQWIIIYLIVGLIIYGIIYFTFRTQSVSYNPSLVPSPSPGQEIIKTAIITSKGKILTDSNGRSLYVFDKDSKGISNCTGSCTALWPPFSIGSFPSNLPENLTAIQRADGSMQLAWKERPLYFYASDQSPGDVNGDGFGGVWHLVKL